jgi:tRNA threonylcarbamoyl adenosine modification protein (Sua5/YciO/YrdC/YwlC family)
VARRLQPTLSEIGDAARALRQGKLVAFPTETVYGLGGDATSDRAVAAIFAAKGRPSFNPLIVHVASMSDAAQHAGLSAKAQAVARSFWPGPLTLVLPRRKDCRISLLATAGLDSVAIRVPAHKIAQTLLMMSGLPLAAPSANPSGRLSPTSADHVLADLGDKVEYVIDGGSCPVGVESTVLSLLEDQPRILRPGAVTADALAETPPKALRAFPARAPGCRGGGAGRGSAGLRPLGPPGHAQPEPDRRPAGGRRQPVRHAAPVGRSEIPRHRRDARARNGPRHRHQRQAAAGGRAAFGNNLLTKKRVPRPAELFHHGTIGPGRSHNPPATRSNGE